MKERILVKHDTATNWAKAKNFIPLDGELILYDGVIEQGQYIETPKLKVGDGIHKVSELPFVQNDIPANKYEYANGNLIIN